MTQLIEIHTISAAQTQDAGRGLALHLRPGDVVLLSGQMGAGKSELARGIAKGLGVLSPVPSPTFSILNVYETDRTSLHHFDFYRVCDPSEIFVSGLDEFIGGDAITLIEWHERAPEVIPAEHLEIFIRFIKGDERLIFIIRHGGFRSIGFADLQGRN